MEIQDGGLQEPSTKWEVFEARRKLYVLKLYIQIKTICIPV